MITCEFEDGNKASLRHVVTDVILVKDSKILLVRRSEKITEGGKWAIVGGYAVRDEVIITAAKREVKEETGWIVNDLTLFRIIDNPVRGMEDRQNISFVYFGEPGIKAGESDWEVTETNWFPLDALPDEKEIAFDHYESIKMYKDYLINRRNLPIIG